MLEIFILFLHALAGFYAKKLITHYLFKAKKVEEAIDTHEEYTRADEIRDEIVELEEQAEGLNSTDTFAQHAKVKRKITKLRKQLAEEEKKAEPIAAPPPIPKKPSLPKLFLKFIAPMSLDILSLLILY